MSVRPLSSLVLTVFTPETNVVRSRRAIANAVPTSTVSAGSTGITKTNGKLNSEIFSLNGALMSYELNDGASRTDDSQKDWAGSALADSNKASVT